MTRAKDRDGISKLGERRYRLSWVEKGTGTRRQKVVKGTLEHAQAVRAAIVDSQTRGAYVSSSSMTLRAYFAMWFDGRELRETNRRTTHERYRSLANSICSHLGDTRLQDLTKSEIEAYYVWCLRHEITQRGTLVSRDTVHKRHKLLKMALEDAVHEDPPLLVRNPAAKAKHPTASKPHGQAFTPEESQIVLAAVHESWVDLPVRIALYTGMRLGEVMALRWRDVHLEDEPSSITISGQVSETKAGFSITPYAKTAGSRRTIGIGAELAETLRRHRTAQARHRLEVGPAWADNDLVVCGLGGQLLRPSKVTARFSPMVRLLEEQGELSTSGATFHSLRHTHATLMLRDGVPVHTVSKRLGHSKIQITLDYYAHVMPGDDEAATETFDGLLARPFDRTSCTLSAQKAASGE